MRFILGDRAAAEATSQLAFCCLFKTAPAGAEPGKREVQLLEHLRLS
jgi:hypothetical protein